MTKSDVLIVGAGPTGLVLALWLTKLGVRVRVVDEAPRAGQTSRAVGVQARTLELYRQLGLAAHLATHGRPVQSAHFWVRGTEEATVAFGAVGEGLSPYPYLMIYPQDQHETFLIERLAAAGVQVERSTELVGFDDKGDHVEARIKRADGTVEVCEGAYLAGCDGARSFVRRSLHLDYPGGTYAHLFYVADVEASGPPMNGGINVELDESDFLACFPLEGATHARLIGTVRGEAEGPGETLDFGVVDRRVIERMRLKVTKVNWFSTYRVHHRVASAFRVGRVFVLGDAAHVHSPVGGQGMNTGIGDAVNLSWKLAAALRDPTNAGILDSFEEERMPFARTLVRTTDRVFAVASSNGPIAGRLRTGVVPRLLPAIFGRAWARRLLFRTISQIRVNYRGSSLSEGRAGRVRGGDRLPWVPYEGRADNFEPLTSLDWQVHVYGGVTGALRGVCEARSLALHVFPWEPCARKAGMGRDAVYLVRPDGYVALAASAARAPGELARYCDAKRLGRAPARERAA